MGLFQQRPEEQENQWTLPSEPFERDESEVLDAGPAVDPLTLGFGESTSMTSILFPATPPAAAASDED